MRERRAKVGVFGIGLEAYWEQFDGLKEKLEGYRRTVEERISQLGDGSVTRPRRHGPKSVRRGRTVRGERG